MKIHVMVDPLMFDNNLYTAIVDYVEGDKNKELKLVNRLGLKFLFKQVEEYFGDRLEEIYSAEITGEFDESDLTEEDQKVWETPIKHVLND